MALGRFAQLSYSSDTGFKAFGGLFDAITGKNQRYDPAGVSMARARDPQNPYVRPRTVLSAVANATAAAAQTALFRQGTRLNPASVPQAVPQTFAAVGEQKLEPLVQKGTQTMSLDLGNLIGNLGSQYISARWGTPRQPIVTNPPFMPQGPRAGVAAQPVFLDTLPEMAGRAYDYFFTDEQAQQLGKLPNAPTGAPMTNGCTPPSYCVDGKTGKVTIKQKRRRRRRLATSSDIRDLSSLKSVLSPADLKMWIATHPS